MSFNFSARFYFQKDNGKSQVLDKLIILNDNTDSLFYQKINVHQVFAAGNSAGGATSFIACGQDRRITKGVGELHLNI